jgi:hypothetical protein
MEVQKSEPRISGSQEHAVTLQASPCWYFTSDAGYVTTEKLLVAEMSALQLRCCVFPINPASQAELLMQLFPNVPTALSLLHLLAVNQDEYTLPLQTPLTPP